jgi:hypothetical protein
MKKYMVAMAFAIGLIATSCNNENTPESIRQHDDGSTRADHRATAIDTTKQEKFKADTLNADSALHTRDESKPHTHDKSKPHAL